MRSALLLGLLVGCFSGCNDSRVREETAEVTLSSGELRGVAASEPEAPALAATVPGTGKPLHRVVGLVTAVDGLDVTVSTHEGERTARLAPGRTRYFGRRGSATSSASLRIASRVRGVVALDGTWASFELRSP